MDNQRTDFGSPLLGQMGLQAEQAAARPAERNHHLIHTLPKPLPGEKPAPARAAFTAPSPGPPRAAGCAAAPTDAGLLRGNVLIGSRPSKPTSPGLPPSTSPAVCQKPFTVRPLSSWRGVEVAGKNIIVSFVPVFIRLEVVLMDLWPSLQGYNVLQFLQSLRESCSSKNWTYF